MNYEDFKRELYEEVVARKPECVKEYEITSVKKNNQSMREGISIHYVENESVSPIIYFDDHYEAYKTGVSIDEMVGIVNDIVIGEYEHVKNFDMNDIVNEQISPNITFRLLNKEWNKDLMERCSYQEIHDLIAVPYIEIDRLGQKASTLVTHDLQHKIFQMTDEELLAAAYENTMQREYTVIGMSEKLREMMSEEFDEIYSSEMFPEKEPMYIMSNSDNWFGAVGMMSQGVMEQIQDKLEEEMFFMLPSSTHEMIVIPASTGQEPEMMQAMVKEVNEQQVEPHERLGENVYFYNGQKLQICNSQQEVMKQIEEKWQQKETQEQTQTHGRRMG